MSERISDNIDKALTAFDREMNRRLLRAAMFLKGKVRDKLSVPAPRARVTSRKGGTIYYRATTPASPGAPPRKLSGRLRGSIDYSLSPDGKTAYVGTAVVYGRTHEMGHHQFLVPTLDENREAIAAILGGTK